MADRGCACSITACTSSSMHRDICWQEAAVHLQHSDKAMCAQGRQHQPAPGSQHQQVASSITGMRRQIASSTICQRVTSQPHPSTYTKH